MPNEYEKLQRAIAETPEQPATVVHIDASGVHVTEHPPLSQDESEYGRTMRALRDDLERSLAGAEGVVIFCDPDRVVLADGSEP